MLPPSLLASAERFITSSANAAARDLRVRYAFGSVVRRWQLGPRGPTTIAALALHLGVDHSALRRFARTCEVITPAEFASLAGLRTARGGALTWSHLELLARESDPRRRRRYAQAIVDENLSVRGLRGRMPARF